MSETRLSIVEWLRWSANRTTATGFNVRMKEAATTIERLSVERERLRETLEQVESVRKEYVKQALDRNPNYDRACLHAEACQAIESYIRNALAVGGAE